MSKFNIKLAKVKMHRWPYSGKLHPVDEKHHEEGKAEYLKRMAKEREKKAMAMRAKHSWGRPMRAKHKPYSGFDKWNDPAAGARGGIAGLIHSKNLPTGTTKTEGGNYPIHKKDSPASKNFNRTFKDARKAGKDKFKWDNREYSTKLKKEAFFGVTPLNIADQEQLESPAGYAKEQANMAAGGMLGFGTGVLGGGGLGYAVAPKGRDFDKNTLKDLKTHLRNNGVKQSKIDKVVKILKRVRPTKAIGAVAGGALGGGLGSVIGSIRSLRKGEREAGVEPTGVGKYLGRSIGSGVAGTAASLATGNQAAGYLVGRGADYLVSRKAQDYHPQLETNG